MQYDVVAIPFLFPQVTAKLSRSSRGSQTHSLWPTGQGSTCPAFLRREDRYAIPRRAPQILSTAALVAGKWKFPSCLQQQCDLGDSFAAFSCNNLQCSQFASRELRVRWKQCGKPTSQLAEAFAHIELIMSAVMWAYNLKHPIFHSSIFKAFPEVLDTFQTDQQTLNSRADIILVLKHSNWNWKDL